MISFLNEEHIQYIYNHNHRTIFSLKSGYDFFEQKIQKPNRHLHTLIHCELRAQADFYYMTWFLNRESRIKCKCT